MNLPPLFTTETVTKTTTTLNTPYSQIFTAFSIILLVIIIGFVVSYGPRFRGHRI